MKTITGIEKLTNEKWLNLFRVNYEIDEKKRDWVFASRKTEPQVGNNSIKADAVMIVAICDKSLVVTKEFRLPIGDYEYGFPAGLIDDNEKPEKTAIRELKEETGLDVTEILYVSPPAISSAGLSDESVVYVVCRCNGNLSREGNEETEDIETQLLSLNEVMKLFNSDVKVSAKALPFIFVFQAMGSIDWPKLT